MGEARTYGPSTSVKHSTTALQSHVLHRLIKGNHSKIFLSEITGPIILYRASPSGCLTSFFSNYAHWAIMAMSGVTYFT